MLLKESLNFIITQAQKHGLDIDSAQNMFGQAENDFREKNPQISDGDQAYANGVVDLFTKKLKDYDITRAKGIVMSQEGFKREAQDFLNHIVDNNYIDAQGHFTKAIDHKLNHMLEKNKAEYLKKLNDKTKS